MPAAPRAFASRSARCDRGRNTKSQGDPVSDATPAALAVLAQLATLALLEGASA